MKTRIFIIGNITLYFLASCGQTAEQKALADKERVDSIIAVTKKATEDSVKRATEDSLRISNGMTRLLAKKALIGDAIPYIGSKVETLKSAKTNADIQMTNIESFHFLRTAQDKQSQISNEAKIQQSIDDRLDALQAILKIFRLAYDEMDGIESKKFNSYTDFNLFATSLSQRIHKMANEIMDESNSSAVLSDKFNFDETLTNANFIAEVQQYKLSNPATR